MKTLVLYTYINKQELILINNMFKDFDKEELFPVSKMEFKYMKDHKLLDYDIVEVNKAQIDAKISNMVIRYNLDKNNLKDELQIIIYGITKGIIKTVNYIHDNYAGIKIKVISNVYEGILFNEYNRKNFLKTMTLLKNEDIYRLYFFKKGVYSTYKELGFNVGYLMENFVPDDQDRLAIRANLEKNKNLRNNILENKETKNINIGAYPTLENWNANVFNTFSVAKFVDNSILRYNILGTKEYEFMQLNEINSIPVYIEDNDKDKFIEELSKVDYCLSLDFTTNFHFIFLLSVEMNVPCLIGNTSDFFDEIEFKNKEYIQTDIEDNPFVNSKKVLEFMNLDVSKKNEIMSELARWKKEYDKIQKDNFNKMIND